MAEGANAGNDDGSLGNKAKKMLMAAARGEWKKVEKIYADTEAVRVATIIRTGDTVLHLAVSSRVESNVKLLMPKIPTNCSGEILEIANKSGDTPLHLAAALGMSEVCRDMAERCPELVTKARNKHGETPLFKAALHGQKEAFRAMRDARAHDASNSRDLNFCPNSFGDSILHVALLNKHFDLALEIVRCYPALANQCNKKGEFPIHILANMPSIFKSGYDFKNLLDKLIYNWIPVDPPESYILANNRENDSRNLPDSNLTSPDIPWVERIFRTRGDGICRRPIPNEEDPEDREDEGSQRKKQNFRKICYELFEWLTLAMFFPPAIHKIFGLPWHVIEMKKQKKIHVRARQIMIKLLEHRPEWDFGEAGRHPSNIRSDWFKLSPEPPEAAAAEDWAESPILLAAKNGITELVEYVLERYPIAVFDLDSNGKNIILLAAEHRQFYIYELMLKRKEMQQSMFGMVDKDGNSAAHLAAKLAPDQPQFLRLPFSRMQRDVRWFKYVERSMDPGFFPRYNKDGLTAREIFTETHRDLLREAGEWLAKTYHSCAIVVGLMVAAASNAANSLPTSVVGQNPSHRQNDYSPSLLGAFVFSGLSLWLFLDFVTWGYEQWDFETKLPGKLVAYLLCVFESATWTFGASLRAWEVHSAFPRSLEIIGAMTLLFGFPLFRRPYDFVKVERAPLWKRSLD